MPRKLLSLPILSSGSPIWVTLKLETGVGSPGCCDSSLWKRRQNLRPSNNDAIGLRIAAVAGVAGGVKKVRAICVVQCGRPLLPLYACVCVKLKLPLTSTIATAR